MSFLTDPLLQVLMFLYTLLDRNFGYAIIGFTFLLRALLVPLSVPAIKSQKKMQSLKPHLDALKAKHGQDKAKLQEEQMKLYKEFNVNPLAGCLPYLLQFVVLIALYQVLDAFLHTKEIHGVAINTIFWGIDLAKPDKTFVLPVLAGVTQFLLSVMVLPGVESHDLVPNNAKTKKLKEANKKEDDAQEMAESIQKQMVFMMPVVTGIAAVRFPAGLAMYWVITTVFSIGQQWVFSGPGGLASYWKKFTRKS